MKLKPGMTANIIVYTQEEKNALLISAKAIKFKPDSSLAKQYKIEKIQRDTTSRRNPPVENNNPSYNNNVAAGNPRSDSSRGHSKQTGFVWVKQDNDLIQKKIKMGLNDDTHIQVIDGLTTDDEVVTAIGSTADKSSAKNGNTQRSPFMPQRPRGNSGTKKQ
jgi:HlyD family secretion protein